MVHPKPFILSVAQGCAPSPMCIDRKVPRIQGFAFLLMDQGFNLQQVECNYFMKFFFTYVVLS